MLTRGERQSWRRRCCQQRGQERPANVFNHYTLNPTALTENIRGRRRRATTPLPADWGPKSALEREIYKTWYNSTIHSIPPPNPHRPLLANLPGSTKNSRNHTVAAAVFTRSDRGHQSSHARHKGMAHSRRAPLVAAVRCRCQEVMPRSCLLRKMGQFGNELGVHVVTKFVRTVVQQHPLRVVFILLYKYGSYFELPAARCTRYFRGFWGFCTGGS